MRNYKSIVADELDAVNKEICSLSIEPKNVRKELQNFLEGSSKRIRTITAALYIKANNKKVSGNSIKIMTAGEIIHNASLLHDDVIDNADERRGEPTLAKIYSPYISILSGDYLLSIATEMLLKIDNKNILNIFLQSTKAMCKSEIQQFFLRGKLPKIEDYIKICEGKTAFLFEAILNSCAIIEGIDTNNAINFAKKFGTYFQLKNDVEKVSAYNDANNKIFTSQDILGIEKTKILMDNYQEEIVQLIGLLPDNVYKKGLEGLLKDL